MDSYGLLRVLQLEPWSLCYIYNSIVPDDNKFSSWFMSEQYIKEPINVHSVQLGPINGFDDINIVQYNVRANLSLGDVLYEARRISLQRFNNAYAH